MNKGLRTGKSYMELFDLLLKNKISKHVQKLVIADILDLCDLVGANSKSIEDYGT